jgi:C_GCAxxG_C_C family probable redox protein
MGKDEDRAGAAIMTREDQAQQAYDRAYDLDVKVGCCPQCVLTALKETIGGVSDDLIKASHGLSGGGGLDGAGTCGALSGGLLALGTRRGRDADKLDQGRGMADFEIGQRLTDRFRQEYGATTCEGLQLRFSGRTWDFWKAEEYKGFSTAREDRCARASGLVARWVIEMLEEETPEA